MGLPFIWLYLPCIDPTLAVQRLLNNPDCGMKLSHKTCLCVQFGCYTHRYITFVFAGCPAECESCVNSDTCTRCRPGLYQLSGRCHHVCPEDYEPNDKLMECTAQGQSCVKTITGQDTCPAGRGPCHVHGP